MNSQFLRYVLSGLIINSIGFISYIIFLRYLNFSTIISVSILYPIIISIYYLMQTYFVFNQKTKEKNLTKFLFNIFLLYFLNITYNISFFLLSFANLFKLLFAKKIFN